MTDDEFGPALPSGASQGDIGPPLPPHLKKNKTERKDQNEGLIGPVLPAKPSSQQNCSSIEEDRDSDLIGPSLPPHLRSKQRSKEESETTDVIGPALPPHLQKRQAQEDLDIIGPALPPNLVSKRSEAPVIGPVLPSSSAGVSVPSVFSNDKTEESDSDDDYIGPRPSEMLSGDIGLITAAEFEERARRMKDKMDGKGKDDSKPVKRESWMTELPDCLGQNIGLQARTFKVNAGPDLSDRSSWTDTPADRERKLKEQSEGSSKKRKHGEHHKSGRDKKLSEEIEQYNKSKRSESLLEMHQKKMKSKKKEEKDEPKVRRAFDRETDLEVNRFDDAQRKAIIKKSQNLNTKFGHGKSQFL